MLFLVVYFLTGFSGKAAVSSGKLFFISGVTETVSSANKGCNGLGK
jgi:energy-converting hydrogenase Eha subunit G